MLLACVHVTSRVRDDRRGTRSEARSLGEDEEAVGFHHFRTRSWRLARSTQGAMFAS